MNTVVKYKGTCVTELLYLVVVMQPDRVPLTIAHSSRYKWRHRGLTLSCRQDTGQRIQLIESRHTQKAKILQLCVQECVFKHYITALKLKLSNREQIVVAVNI